MQRALAIGIDVGGTKIAAGLVEFPSGRVFDRRVTPTAPARGGEAVLEDALALARGLLTEAARRKVRVVGVGLGVAELVTSEGNVSSSQTMAWSGLPVRERLAELAPAVVESDVRAAALAESKFGAGRPFRNFAFIIVGTGISYCLVVDGEPYAGARGNALVLATGAETSVCPKCGTEFDFVLEEFASGPALVARYNERAGTKATRGEEILAAAAGGDGLAREVVESAGRALGSRLGTLVNLLDPEALIVGGGLGLAGGLYWENLAASTRRHIWPEASRDLPILRAALGADAGLIGAATYAWLRFGERRAGTTWRAKPAKRSVRRRPRR